MENSQTTDLLSLLRAAQGGDRSAFAALLEHFHPLLSAQAAGELGSTLDPKMAASDLVQECLLEAYRDFQNFRGTSIAQFRTWLRQILAHRAIDLGRQFRTERRDVSRESSQPLRPAQAADNAKSASTIAQDRETLERVAACLQGLSDEERTIVLLRYRDELGFDDIATRLGWSRERVRRTWYSAIEIIGRQTGECR